MSAMRAAVYGGAEPVPSFRRGAFELPPATGNTGLPYGPPGRYAPAYGDDSDTPWLEANESMDPPDDDDSSAIRWHSPLRTNSIPSLSVPPAPARRPSQSLQGDEHSGQVLAWVAWIPLPLCVLLGAVIVLLYRHYARRAANLLLSRDRAQLDLQLLTHRASRVQIGMGDAPCSLPDSLPDQRPLPLRCAPLSIAAISLPPGPPSSSNDLLVMEQEQAAPPPRVEADQQGLGEGAGGSRTEQKQAAPPPEVEAGRQGLGERVGGSRTEQIGGSRTEQKQAAPFDWIDAYRKRHAQITGFFKQKQAAVPLSWVEADRRFYAEQAARAQIEQTQAAPLTREEADRQGLARQELAAEALADLSGNVATSSTATGGDAISYRALPPASSSPTPSSSTYLSASARPPNKRPRPPVVSNATAAPLQCTCTLHITCSSCRRVPGCACNGS